MTSAHVTELIAVTIESALDAARLARFYAGLTGGEVTGDYPGVRGRPGDDPGGDP